MDKRFLAVLAILFCLAFILSALSCDCEEDDDDDKKSGGDDDDDVSDEDIEKIIVQVIENLDTEGENGAWVAYMMPEPLGKEDEIAPAEGESSYTPGGDYWFIYADEDPYAQFEHKTKFIFVDVASGEMTVEDQTWWPEVNGVAIFTVEDDLIRIFSSTITHELMMPPFKGTGKKSKAEAPTADYGDAPDDTVNKDDVPAYPYGTGAGHFPTVYETDNTEFDRPGGHTLTVGEEYLGVKVSAEKDATDPNDPDDVFNLIDNDKDDKIYWIIWKSYKFCSLKVRFLFQVTVAATAPDQDRYVNILVDHNADGKWEQNTYGAEWLVQNDDVRVPPGKTEWYITNMLNMPLKKNCMFGYQMWIRIALTRAKIDATPFGLLGWDGSGAFEYGEIEDHYFNFLPWYGDDDDDDDDVDDDDDAADDDSTGDDDDATGGGPEQPPVGKPGDDAGTKECIYVCQEDDIPIPIDCSALIINLGDTPGNNWMHRNGLKAQNFFNKYYGKDNTEFMNLPTADEAEKAIKEFLEGGICLDEKFIYLVGHGGSSGYIRARNGHDKLTVEELRAIMDNMDHCPDMDYYVDGCDEEGYCNINFLIQSCYSGKFLDGSKSMAIPGVNMLTSANKYRSSYGRRDGNGSYVSNEFWEAFKNDQADNPPSGDEDGETSMEEAMDYAKNNYGGEKSKPQTHAGEDCNCSCTLDFWEWVDPPDDMFYWHQAGTPVDVGALDIIEYAIYATTAGFDAIIRTSGNLPLDLMAFYEYYVSFDSDDIMPNCSEPGPTQGADNAYIAQFLNGVYKMFHFVWDGALWNAVATTATVEVTDNEMIMHIDAAEAGFDFSEGLLPVYMATWYLEGGTLDAGDKTDVEIKQPKSGSYCNPPKRSR